MVEIYCIKNNEKGRYSLEVQGHADYGPYGEDIVCSAVSVLTYTLNAALEELEGIEIKKISQFKNGFVTIIIEVTDLCQYATQEKMIDRIDMALLGYRLLEEQYPNHVKVHM